MQENMQEANKTGGTVWKRMRTMNNGESGYKKEKNKINEILKDNGYQKDNGYLKTALGILGIFLMLSIPGLGTIDNQTDLAKVAPITEGAITSPQKTVMQNAITDASREVTIKRLTSSSVDDRQPSWSKDSQYISFMSRSGGWQIKKMKVDGSSMTTLAGGAGGIEPAWQPSNKIAFSRGTSDSTMDVYVMNIDGTGVKKLTNTPQYDEYPDWNRDATKIAFVSQWSRFNGPKYISTMNADGSNKKNLGVVGIQPSWSPDGTKIAYKCYEAGANICIVNADGSNKRRLTSESANTHEPDWSPNGKYIAYASKRDGDFEIYAINVDGTNKRQLTSNNVEDNHPSWSPDGTKIAYSSRIYGNDDIFVMGGIS